MADLRTFGRFIFCGGHLPQKFWTESILFRFFSFLFQKEILNRINSVQSFSFLFQKFLSFPKGNPEQNQFCSEYFPFCCKRKVLTESILFRIFLSFPNGHSEQNQVCQNCFLSLDRINSVQIFSFLFQKEILIRIAKPWYLHCFWVNMKKHHGIYTIFSTCQRQVF